MLTIFACPKPFTDPHIAIIQRNAITSWTLLRPKPEIILFGDEVGVAEIAQELNVQHQPFVVRNKYGTPLVNYIFKKAQLLAQNTLLCYVNSDIILTNKFIDAILIISQSNKSHKFLMIGRRIDVDIDYVIDFSTTCWEDQIEKIAEERGILQSPDWIDYFVFPKGLFVNIPPFALGKTCYDNWLVWYANSEGYAVIDATKVVKVIHQNHGDSVAKGYVASQYIHEQVQENRKLMGGPNRWYTILHAKYVLTHQGVKRAWSKSHLKVRIKDFKRTIQTSSRPFREKIGLTKRQIMRIID